MAQKVIKSSATKINNKKPIITPKEARKILGKDVENLSDEQLYSVIINIEAVIELILNNIEVKHEEG